nr:alpha/beta hydrolase [Acidimicrobiia bacterium]
VLGHSWGGHLLLHLIASRPDRVSAALVVDPLGAVGDGGMGRFEAELTRRTPGSDRERTAEIDERAMTGEATESELLESLRLVWPAYFSTPERAGSMPPIGLSIEAYTGTCASIVETLPALPGRLLGCTVPTRFVHGGESPMPVAASTETAALLDAEVDVVPDAGHFVWLEAPGSVRRALDALD